MSETKTEQTTWVRYRHLEKPKIEFDVQSDPDTGEPLPFLFKGEVCHRVRTVRNLAFHEEVHQAAYTYMPCERFGAVYERDEG